MRKIPITSNFEVSTIKPSFASKVLLITIHASSPEPLELLPHYCDHPFPLLTDLYRSHVSRLLLQISLCETAAGASPLTLLIGLGLAYQTLPARAPELLPVDVLIVFHMRDRRL